MIARSLSKFRLDLEDIEALRNIGLGSNRGDEMPLSITLDRKGKKAEVWKASYSYRKADCSRSRTSHVRLSHKARKAAHPFLALKEAYEHVTSLPSTVVLTSPVYMKGREDNTIREKALEVIDELISKSSKITEATAALLSL